MRRLPPTPNGWPARATLARTGGLRRETPVFLRLEDGRLAEGVVDLAFREPGGDDRVAVDFKTDQELEPRREVHEGIEVIQ